MPKNARKILLFVVGLIGGIALSWVIGHDDWNDGIEPDRPGPSDPAS